MFHRVRCQQATRTLVHHDLWRGRRHFVTKWRWKLGCGGPGTGKYYREMQLEREKPVGMFQLGKRDYLLSSSTFSGNFPVGWTEKTFSIYPRTEIFGIFDKWKAPRALYLLGARTEWKCGSVHLSLSKQRNVFFFNQSGAFGAGCMIPALGVGYFFPRLFPRRVLICSMLICVCFDWFTSG